MLGSHQDPDRARVDGPDNGGRKILRIAPAFPIFIAGPDVEAFSPAGQPKVAGRIEDHARNIGAPLKAAGLANMLPAATIPAYNSIVGGDDDPAFTVLDEGKVSVNTLRV